MNNIFIFISGLSCGFGLAFCLLLIRHHVNIFKRNLESLDQAIKRKSDLYKAIEKIEAGKPLSAKNFIERYINSH